ncbi:hypothetical protein TGAM01_v205128, partial [Trichoderma gamsii]
RIQGTSRTCSRSLTERTLCIDRLRVRGCRHHHLRALR